MLQRPSPLHIRVIRRFWVTTIPLSCALGWYLGTSDLFNDAFTEGISKKQQQLLDSRQERLEPYLKLWEHKNVHEWDPQKPSMLSLKYLDHCLEDALKLQRVQYDICVLFPLCGASHDISYIGKYLSELLPNKTIHVIGIEASSNAIEFWFNRENISYQKTYEMYSKSQYPVYVSKGKTNSSKTNLIYYFVNGDFFDLKMSKIIKGFTMSFKHVDLIFDRGSLSILDFDLHRPYIHIIDNVCRFNGGTVLLELFRYGEKGNAKFNGKTIKTLTPKLVDQLYNTHPIRAVVRDGYSVELLESHNCKTSKDIYIQSLVEDIKDKNVEAFIDIYKISRKKEKKGDQPKAFRDTSPGEMGGFRSIFDKGGRETSLGHSNDDEYYGRRRSWGERHKPY